MKKVLSLCLALALLMSMMGTQVFAFTGGMYDSTQDVYPQDSGNVDITTSGGKEIELIGHIEPSIISVTMPAYIPFDMSASVEHENKVVSPKIEIRNNSYTPVTISVDRTKVNLSNMQGTSWAENQWVSYNQIAVGLMQTPYHPGSLSGATWLKDGAMNAELMRLSGYGSNTLFVVGTLGAGVPENKTFSVTPTLIVRATY